MFLQISVPWTETQTSDVVLKYIYIERERERERERENKALCDSWAPQCAGRTEYGVVYRKYNKVQACFVLETFYSKFLPLRALRKPAQLA